MQLDQGVDAVQDPQDAELKRERTLTPALNCALVATCGSCILLSAVIKEAADHGTRFPLELLYATESAGSPYLRASNVTLKKYGWCRIMAARHALNLTLVIIDVEIELGTTLSSSRRFGLHLLMRSPLPLAAAGHLRAICSSGPKAKRRMAHVHERQPYRDSDRSWSTSATSSPAQ